MLEVGPGRGILTRYLAERVAHVHAVELDRCARARARAASRARASASGDALRLEPGSLDPPPGKLVANLPYNIATPLVVESLDRLPSVAALVRDGAARGRRAASSPRRRTKAYGAVSVLVQLATRAQPASTASRARSSGRGRTSSRRWSRSSARAPGLPAGAEAARRGVLRPPPQDARELARARRGRCPRAGARRRSSALGLDPALRAEELAAARRSSPLADELCVDRRARATRRSTSASPSARCAPTACTRSRRSCSASISPTRSRSSPRAELRVEGFAADTLVRRALEAVAAAAGVEPALAGADRQAHPRRRGPRRRQLRRRDRAPARERSCSARRSSRAALAALARSLGSDVPFFLEPGPKLATGDGTTLEPLDLPQDYAVVLLLPGGEQKAVDRERLRPLRRRRGLRGAGSARCAGSRRRAGAPTSPRCPGNDLACSPLRRAPARARRLPRRGERCRAGRLRPLRGARRRGGRCRRARARSARAGSPPQRGSVLLDDEREGERARQAASRSRRSTCASTAFGFTLWTAAIEGLLVCRPRHPASRGLRCLRSIAIGFWVTVARRYNSATARNVELDLRRLAGARGAHPGRASSSPSAIAIGAIAIIAVIALVILFAERERV